MSVAATILEGAPNFRDFGGQLTESGRRVRRGVVFRSEELVALTDADLEAILGIRFRLICDLRSDLERQKRPNRWPEGDTPLEVFIEPMSAKAMTPAKMV